MEDAENYNLQNNLKETLSNNITIIKKHLKHFSKKRNFKITNPNKKKKNNPQKSIKKLRVPQKDNKFTNDNIIETYMKEIVKIHILSKQKEFEILKSKDSEKAIINKLIKSPVIIYELSKEIGWTKKKVEDVKNVSKKPLSLDIPLEDNDNVSLISNIEDKESLNPFNIVSQKIFKEQLEKVLNTLPFREKEIIKMRYDIKDGKEKTLEEVGNVFKISRERIRQIESKALNKLRNPLKCRQLKDYLNDI